MPKDDVYHSEVSALMEKLKTNPPHRQNLVARIAAYEAVHLIDNPDEQEKLQSQGRKDSPAVPSTAEEIGFLKSVLLEIAEGGGLALDPTHLDYVRKMRERFGATSTNMDEHEGLSDLLRNVIEGLEYRRGRSSSRSK